MRARCGGHSGRLSAPSPRGEGAGERVATRARHGRASQVCPGFSDGLAQARTIHAATNSAHAELKQAAGGKR